jgi:protein gp37
MAETTTIEWTDATWNPITGCSVHSAGCTNCYAMKLAGTRLQHHPSRAGLTIDTKAGPVWNGQVRLNPEWLDQPLRWKRPRTIFVCAHADLFHESVPDEWIDQVFTVMALCPQHRFQVLTKRADRMQRYLRQLDEEPERDTVRRIARALTALKIFGLDEDGPGLTFPCPNVWLGVSVEDQRAADERIPHLLATPAAVRFLSCEPLLGPVDLTALTLTTCTDKFDAFEGMTWTTQPAQYAGGRLYSGRLSGAADRQLDWVIVGGESGPGARPMHSAWAQQLRDQCVAAGVPFFFKQWGEWAPVCAMSEELTDSCYHSAPARDPEATRRCKVDQCVLHQDGLRFGKDEWEKTREGERILAFQAGHGAMTMFQVGKKAAGRLLDGVQHDGMPA